MEETEFREKCGYFDANFEEIKANVERAAQRSGRQFGDITILAATKTVDVSVINYAIENGIDYIGENKVQEFLSKYESYSDCHRQFIGHLQTNKVKDIVGKVELIQSVDSIKLAKEISKQSIKKEVETDILIEVNIGREEGKSGVCEEDLFSLIEEIKDLPNIHIKGLMAIPPISEGEELTGYFKSMKRLFDKLASSGITNAEAEILSMGMSSDYAEAIENGATMVRIGTSLFGKRNYNM